MVWAILTGGYVPGKEAISCQLSAGFSWFSTNHTQTPYNPRQRQVKLKAHG